MDTIQDIMNYLNSHHCPYSHIENALLVNSESIKLLRHFPANSIDSSVVDGPYMIGFMGKDWDNLNSKSQRDASIRFQHWTYEWAKELYRVLKPGAHLLSFCSPRTYHRMATGIEDGGFEIRDQLQYLYGSGFPKSRNISKDIDNIMGKEGKVFDVNYNFPSTTINSSLR
jgi:site-specific DNA-methyltransferase (adenine-specific)